MKEKLKGQNFPNLRFQGFNGEWEVMKLGDITRWSSGGTPPKDNSLFWDGDIPWISASSMRGNVYSDSELKITEAGLKKGSKLAEKGTLLILVRGSMLFNKIPIGIAAKNVAFNQDVKSIVVNDCSTSEYILNWFTAFEGKILNMVTGTGIGAGKLDLPDLKALEIKIPPLPEQIKLANFLFNIDQRISTQKKIIEGLIVQKNSISKKIFNQKLSFVNTYGKKFPDWEKKKIKEIFDITRGNVLSMSLVNPNPNRSYIYPVYSSQTKNNGLSGYFDDFLFEDCITWTTDGAGAGDVNFRKGKFYCTNVCGVLKSKEGYSNLFIAEILNSISRKHVSYVGNPKLMNNVMAEILINIPQSFEEQDKISKFLSLMERKIKIEKNLLAQYKLKKKYLLSNLFV